MILLIDTYGTEAFDWSPQTIAMEIHDDFQVQIPQANIDKIMAGIMILTTDDFYHRLPTFNHICNVMSGDPFDPMTFEPATPEEIAWAIVEAALLYPPEEDDRFTAEILAYITHMMESEGIFNPPSVLAFAVPTDRPDPLGHFTDDPAMYQAFSENQASHSGEIDNLIKEELQDLMQQLSTLPLNNGSTEELVSKLKQELTR